MGRPRRQEPRRAHLIAATQRVLARDGLAGLRVREIAAEAEMSPASVLYYFPDSFQLVLQALDQQARAMASERAAVAAATPDPLDRLRALVRLDLPDELLGVQRAFCEIPGQVGDHPELASVMEFVVCDQVAAYTAALQDAQASERIDPHVDVAGLAHGLVASLRGAELYVLCGLLSAAQARPKVISGVELLFRPSRPVGLRTIPSLTAAAARTGTALPTRFAR